MRTTCQRRGAYNARKTSMDFVEEDNDGDCSSDTGVSCLSKYDDDVVSAANEVFCAWAECEPFDEERLLLACRAGEKHSMWTAYLWWSKGEPVLSVDDTERQRWGFVAWYRGAIESEEEKWIPRADELAAIVRRTSRRQRHRWLKGTGECPAMEALASDFDAWVDLSSAAEEK